MISLVVTPSLLEPIARLLAGGQLTGEELDSIDALLAEIPATTNQEEKR